MSSSLILAAPQPFAATEASSPLAWVLHDGKAGMRSQALGLAEATRFRFIEKPLDIRRPWSILPPQLWPLSRRTVRDGEARLGPPWPDLVIGCGRNTVVPALAIRRAAGRSIFLAQVQDPRIKRSEFDLLVVPEHDRLRGPNVIVSRGAMHRVTQVLLATERSRFPALAALPRPVVTVLIGGSNKAYRLTLRRLGEIADAIGGILCESGGSALVTPSRRTGAAGQKLIRDRLAGLPAIVWDGTGDNPYFAFLALADAFFVTADSVSMISEAAATGRPVHIFDIDGGGAKFARFHRLMREAGITRPFAGRLEPWTYPIPQDTARGGATLRALVLSRLDQWPQV
ncbi:MAG: mitochondrial fission ELM1 family protein [Alphaproteobacteria bacterium]|nr:mitochondrial fission ELM1 family protein [Alphaproteobacteria bacterium]